MGMQDKFNESKDQFSDNSEDMKDKADNLYNKAKGSESGDRIDDVSDSARERAQDTVGGMRDERRTE